uniref:Uncharacterized protein n=1 Tax=Romanomermis culicivorax TaxID=13658 RepID=A0A915JXC8_ROMCU
MLVLTDVKVMEEYWLLRNLAISFGQDYWICLMLTKLKIG